MGSALRSFTLATSDVDAFVTHLRGVGWDAGYNQLSSGRFSAALDSVSSPGVQVILHRHQQSFAGAGFMPRGAYAFGLLVSGDGAMSINHHSMGADSITVRYPYEAIDYKFPPAANFLTISASANRLDELADAALGQRMSQILRRGQVLTSSNADVVALSRSILEEGAGGSGQSVGSPHILGDLGRFDRAMMDALLRAIRLPDPIRGWSARRRIVRKAEELVCSSDEPPATVTELCVALGVPLRTLEDAFKHCLGLPPKSYITAMRLNRVRRLLAQPCSDTTVTEVATALGFFHLSRFAEQYSRLFGEKPSETLARARR
ncbi:MAG: helix-turn-helix domain-containing protein [Alphaproteobacteria bacterium]|nr:helix-turn-helix domain-containing protein [Alphaproteobacteria bacterium]